MALQCAVASSASQAVTQSVEVSGWDVEGQFFVEIADLDLDASGDTTALLCHKILSGSLVFVRLLHGEGDTYEKGHPAANEAQTMDLPDFTGRTRIRLTPCQPRNTRRPGDRKMATRI